MYGRQLEGYENFLCDKAFLVTYVCTEPQVVCSPFVIFLCFVFCGAVILAILLISVCR